MSTGNAVDAWRAVFKLQGRNNRFEMPQIKKRKIKKEVSSSAASECSVTVKECRKEIGNGGRKVIRSVSWVRPIWLVGQKAEMHEIGARGAARCSAAAGWAVGCQVHAP